MHGDFRLSNLLVHDGQITAVLDWELCTVGDPLADLAWLLDDWRSPDEPAISMPSPTRAGGFPSRAELIETYRDETGFLLDRLGYYRGFTQWRAASLLQGVLTRRRLGVMGTHGAMDLELLDDSIAVL
jgi:aminoglycoside phosphotransferase (APT) family kinase protein